MLGTGEHVRKVWRTLVRTVAVNAILLAQTIHTTLATRYRRRPAVRVRTLMFFIV